MRIKDTDYFSIKKQNRRNNFIHSVFVSFSSNIRQRGVGQGGDERNSISRHRVQRRGKIVGNDEPRMKRGFLRSI
jgi:hypothetical protein